MTDDLDSLEPIDLAATPPTVPSEMPPTVWPEGWYADPWTAGQYRYWNGRTWTGATHRWGPANASGTGVTTEAWPAAPRGYAVPTLPAAELTETAPPRRRSLVVAAIVALVAVLVASGAIGYAINANSQSDQAVQTTPGPTTTPTTVPHAVSRDPDRRVLGDLGLRTGDVAASRTVMLYPQGNTLRQPTLDLCNARFASERLRTARLQLVDVDGTASPSLSTEAVLYRSPAAAAQAFGEIRHARATCPPRPVISPSDGTKEKTVFQAAPDTKWPATPTVQRLAYRMVTTTAGQSSPLVTVYLRRGRALLGLYFPAPGGRQPAVAGQTSIAGIVQVFERRMAALPAAVVARTTG